VIFDTVDVHFLREQRQAELSADSAALKRAAETRELELDGVRQADSTVVVSANEANLLQEMCPDASLRIISMIHEPLAEVADFEARRGLVFVGGFEHRPNQDGVEWFVSRVLPKIRTSLPEEPFWIVGSGAAKHLKRFSGSGVTVVGWIRDLGSIYARPRLSVAPLRFGAGVKGKITQSLAHGLPCVATSIACEGMPLVHQESVLIADDEASFAAAVVRLHQDRDLWRSLSSAGLQIVSEHYSRTRAEGELVDLLRGLPG
jgi:glycosyltransferase involved in cell wall biosynthesis